MNAIQRLAFSRLLSCVFLVTGAAGAAENRSIEQQYSVEALLGERG